MDGFVLTLWLVRLLFLLALYGFLFMVVRVLLRDLRAASRGPVELGRLIVVAAPRRGPAFEASRYAIERIKETVPIWKREVWSDGYVWVGSQVGTRAASEV